MTFHPKRSSAYTLIEMLVVLAIIGVLSALLFGVFSRVREKGRAAHCQSNLRQIGLAFQQYTADNGRFPLWYNTHLPTNPLPSSFPGIPWAVRIGTYIKEPTIFHCPSSSKDFNPNPMVLNNESGFTCYGYQVGLSDLTEAQVGHPAEVMMLFDDFATAGWAANLNSMSLAAPSGAGDRHSGGSNLLFVDGHVKWVRVNQAFGYDTVH